MVRRRASHLRFRRALGRVSGSQWVLLLLIVPAVAAGRVPPPAACSFQIAPMAAPTSGPAPLLVSLSVSVSNGTPSSYSWNFGDGGYYNGSTGRTDPVLHEYELPGVYAAEITVVEADCSVSASVPISVSQSPLSVSLTATPSIGPAPLTVQFRAVPAGGTGSYRSLDWSFGNGAFGSGPSIRYTYSEPGNFTTVVNVTDTSGNSSSSSIEIVVTDAGESTPSSAPPPRWWIAAVGAIAAAGVVIGASLALLRHRRTASATPRVPPDLTPGEETFGASTSSVGIVGAPTLARGESETRLSPPPAPTGDPEATKATESTPRKESMRPPVAADTLLLSQRVVLHIARQGLLNPDDVAPNELTQSGMATKLESSQSTLSHVLHSLAAAGILQASVRHVRGRARRVKVYTLTYRGQLLAREIRQRPRGPT